MKKIIKYALTMMIVCFVVCAGFAMMPAEAAEEGATAASAIKLNEGVYHTKWWTYSNYKSDCYNKIVIPERGCMTFTVLKPFSETGEIESYDFILYNSKGEVVWAADSYEQIKSFNDSFVYNIGLAAGTYYMDIDPSFNMYKDSAKMETRYKYDFEACDNMEIENNNTFDAATEMKIGKLYSGVYGEESFDYTYADCYRVSLIKGTEYELIFENYDEIEDLIFNIYGADGTRYVLPTAKKEGRTTKWNFTVSESGTYYYRLESCGNGAGVEYKIGMISVTKELEFVFTEKVSGIKATQTTTAINLSWNKLSQATGYRVYQYSPSKKRYVKVASVKTNLFEKTGLKAGTTYKFKIKAYKKLSDGTVVWAEDSAVFTTATKCKAPQITTIKNYSSSPKVKLEWSKVTGATGYQAYYATSKNGEYKKITLKSANADSVIKKFTSSASGKKIYFKVRAYTKVGGKTIYSAWSPLKSVVLN